MWRSPVVLAISILALVSSAAQAQTPTAWLDAFARTPAVRSVQISPDGRRLMAVRLAPDGLYQVEIRDTADVAQAISVFGAEPAEPREAIWLSDRRIMVQLREKLDGRNGLWWGEFLAVFDDDGVLRYRLPGSMPEVLGPPKDGVLMISYDSTGDGSPDVHRLNIETGRSDRVLRGSNRRSGFMVDREGEVRISATFDPSRFAVTLWSRSKGGEDWSLLYVLEPLNREEFRPMGFFHDDPNALTVIAHDGAQHAALKIFDLATRRFTETIFAAPDVDVQDVLVSSSGRLVGARYATDRPRVAWFDAALEARARGLEGTVQDTTALVRESSPTGFGLARTDGPRDPGSFYLVDPSGKASLLARTNAEATALSRSTQTFSSFTARDGLEIPLYVTRPAGLTGASPLIVLPHGGPWARDDGGWNEWVQILVAQGWTVAQPQFRGSTGFSRDLWIAGDRQWGGAMQDDLDDAAAYLVSEGLADRSQIAIVGWSYGGYAALIGAARQPSPYRCSVAGAAVSDLDEINAGLAGNYILRRLQKPTIAGPSPSDLLQNSTIPVLVIHGSIDATVPIEQGQRAAAALAASKGGYRFDEIGGLDHQLDRFSAQDKRQVYGAIVDWLATRCGFQQTVEN